MKGPRLKDLAGSASAGAQLKVSGSNTKQLVFWFYSTLYFSTYSSCQKRAIWGTQLLACGEMPFSPPVFPVDDATADPFSANSLPPTTFVLNPGENTYIKLTSLSNTIQAMCLFCFILVHSSFQKVDDNFSPFINIGIDSSTLGLKIT